MMRATSCVSLPWHSHISLHGTCMCSSSAFDMYLYFEDSFYCEGLIEWLALKVS
jgi:hypothetical protein